MKELGPVKTRSLNRVASAYRVSLPRFSRSCITFPKHGIASTREFPLFYIIRSRFCKV